MPCCIPPPRKSQEAEAEGDAMRAVQVYRAVARKSPHFAAIMGLA